jgi:hypothetical protein
MYTARAVSADEQVFVRARENAMQSHNRNRLGAAVAIVCVSALALVSVTCDSVPVGPSLTNVTFSGLNGASIQNQCRVARVAVPDRGAQ